LLLALLPLLAALARALLPALGAALLLVAAEGVVAQLLLAADHVGEPVERALALLALFAVLALLLLLLLAAGLKVLQHLLQLLHQALGLVAGAVAGEVLDAVQHVAQVLRANLARVGIALRLLLVAVLAVAHGLLGELAHQPVHGLAQVLRQAADLLLRGAALDGLAQALGGLGHGPLGLGDVAVLHAHGDVPEIVHDLDERRVVAGADEAEIGGAQAEIDRRLHAEAVGSRRDRLQGAGDPRGGVGVEGEDAALLDEGARHRLGEGAGRQGAVDRLREALVAGVVLRAQLHRHLQAGEGMGDEVTRRLAVALAGAGLRQGERQGRQVGQGPRAPSRWRARADGASDRVASASFTP
jgi:hypothetical protein